MNYKSHSLSSALYRFMRIIIKSISFVPFFNSLSFQNLEVELVAKGKTVDQLNSEIEKLTLNHSKAVEKYDNDMKLLQQSHAQNIDRFKKESELILKESQGQLIGEWEKNRQEITNTKDSVIQSLEQENENQKKLNKDLQAKFALKDIRVQQLVKEMEGLRQDIDTYTQKLKEMTKLCELEKKKRIELTEEISKFKVRKIFTFSFKGRSYLKLIFRRKKILLRASTQPGKNVSVAG